MAKDSIPLIKNKQLDRPIWAPVLLFFLAFLIYANSIPNQYALDDAIVLTQNDYTQKGLSGIAEILSTDAFEAFFDEKKELVAGGRYRPLSIVTFALEYQFFGLNPEISHFLNVLLFALCGLLLYKVLQNLFPESRSGAWYLALPFWVTLIFVVHPIHTEVVANIKGRDEILALLLALGSLNLALKAVDKQSLIHAFASGGCFFLALLAKESALPFLLLVPLAIYTFREKGLKAAALPSGIIFLFFLAYIGLRASVVGLSAGAPTQEILNDPFVGASFTEQIATAFKVMGLYIGKLINPWPLSHDYYFNQIPVVGFSDPLAIASLLLYLGLAALAIKGLIDRKPYGFALAFYLGTLFIVSNLLLSIGTTMGERFLFIPSIGFFLALLLGVQHAFQRFGKAKNPQRTILIGVGLLAVAYSGMTIARNPVWYDNLTLFTTDAETSPNSAKVRTSAGGALVEAADSLPSGREKTQYYQEAIGHLDAAVRIYPSHGQAWLLRGNAQFGLGQYKNALASFDQVKQLRPGMKEAWQNSAVVASKAKLFPQAAENYRRLAEYEPNNALVWYSRGLNFEEAGIPDSALFAYHRALDLDPQSWETMGKMALVYGRYKGDLANAVLFGEKALEAGSGAEWIFENLGIAHAMKGNAAEAIRVFQNGLKSNPASAKLHLNLGITYANLGDSTQSQAAFQKAFELDPSLQQR